MICLPMFFIITSLGQSEYCPCAGEIILYDVKAIFCFCKCQQTVFKLHCWIINGIKHIGTQTLVQCFFRFHLGWQLLLFALVHTCGQYESSWLTQWLDNYNSVMDVFFRSHPIYKWHLHVCSRYSKLTYHFCVMYNICMCNCVDKTSSIFPHYVVPSLQRFRLRQNT